MEYSIMLLGLGEMRDGTASVAAAASPRRAGGMFANSSEPTISSAHAAALPEY